MNKVLTVVILSFLPFCFLQAQTVIWSEDFNGYANCTTTGANNNTANPANDWTSTFTDCDDAVSCDPGQSFWGVFNGEFRVNDIEGGPCTCGAGGTTENYITTEAIDISAFNNVSINVTARFNGAMETGPLGACDNSGDNIQVTYSLDGGPFTELANNGLLSGSFAPNPAIANEACINGNNLVVRIQAGNKANAEDFYLDDIIVQGFSSTANAGIDDTICPGQNTVLSASGGGTYTWNASPSLSCTNCQSPTASPLTTETFVVNVDQGGCVTSDSVTVIVEDLLDPVNLGNDTTVCGAISILLDATQIGATYVWQDASTNPTFNVTQAGTYSVSVFNNCGSVSDNIIISQGGTSSVNLGADQVLCPGNVMNFNVTDPNALAYLWQDGDTNAVYSTSDPGTYVVTITSPCNTVSDTIELIAPLEITNVLEDINGVCFDDSILVSLEDQYPGVDFLWSNGDTTAYTYIDESGEYYVTINYCGAQYVDSFNVNVLTAEPDAIYLANAFTPNGDELNEYYKVYGVFNHTTSFQANIFNHWGELIYSSSDPDFKWDGTYKEQPAKVGVYYLMIEMEKQCEDQQYVTVGTRITLIR